MAEHIKMISEDQFEKTIEHGVTLVDFYADWCGPCRIMTPHLEAVAKEMEGKVTIVKIDVDKAQQVSSTYQITSIPTLVLFKDGKQVDTMVGVRDAKAIKEFVGKAS